MIYHGNIVPFTYSLHLMSCCFGILVLYHTPWASGFYWYCCNEIFVTIHQRFLGTLAVFHWVGSINSCKECGLFTWGLSFSVPHKYCLNRFSLEVLEDRICQLSDVHWMPLLVIKKFAVWAACQCSAWNNSTFFLLVLILWRIVSELNSSGMNLLFLWRTQALWFCAYAYPPHCNFYVMLWNCMNNMAIFRASVCIILAIYIPILYKPCSIWEKHELLTRKSFYYWFLKPPSVPTSCFLVQGKELYVTLHGHSIMFCCCECWGFDTPLWTPNRCKDFLEHVSFSEPVSSNTLVKTSHFICPAVYLLFEILPLFFFT
jgi:hypothetical protein